MSHLKNNFETNNTVILKRGLKFYRKKILNNRGDKMTKKKIERSSSLQLKLIATWDQIQLSSSKYMIIH